MSLISKLTICLLLTLPFLISPRPSIAATIPYELTSGIPVTPVKKGEIFLETSFTINYQSGDVILSSNPDGTGQTQVDDAIQIKILQPNGKILSYNHSYEIYCSYLSPMNPVSLKNFFSPGVNTVSIKMYDVCGFNKSSSPIYFVNTGAPDPSPSPTPTASPTPEPFLDLPWDYQSKGLSFNEAALNINSYFDHEYPLLSSGLMEPESKTNLTLGFDGRAEGKDYSSHDGYDWGTRAKANIGDPILAAASGTATYINSCSPCGNMIIIDHHNGYQTRYLHMQKDGLIINTPGQKVEVSAKQPIGKVGATGNVSPPGDAGAHIHFGVFQDKNKDGSFEDNIPDGVTDPFGWQSKDADPWENYAFSYAGKQRTGNKSFYLWKSKLDNLDSTLTSNGGVFKTERSTLNFPQNTTDQNLKLNIKSTPFTKVSEILESIGSTIIATATDPLGSLITTFQSFYTLTIDFKNFDLSKYKTDTLSIYSSEDGKTWTKETTSVDMTNKTASSLLNHMSYFALMAERLDTIPPITTANLLGDRGKENWFRSDVNLIIDAQDNEDGLGIDYTMYRKEGEDWEIYTAPLSFTNEGHYKIELYSADKDENIESIKTLQFDIDKTIPEAKIFIDQNIPDLVIQGIDQNLDKVERQENMDTKKRDDTFFLVSDLAGNTLRLDIRDRDKEKNDKFKIFSLSYNDQTKSELSDNLYNVKYKGKGNEKIVEEQSFEIKSEVKIKIKFDKEKNQSAIITKETSQEKIKETREGLVLLQLITNKGNLEYSY